MAIRLSKEQIEYFEQVLDRRSNYGLDEKWERLTEFERLVQEGYIEEDEALFIKMKSFHGLLLSTKGEHKAAIAVLQDVLNICRKFQNHLWELRTLNNIAFLKNIMGDVFEAIEIWERLLMEDIDIEDRALYSTNLGTAYSKAMKPKDAMRIYHEALEMLMNHDAPILKADLYNNLATLNRKSQNYQKAIDFFILALNLYKESGNNERLAMIYNNFCATYIDMQELDKADEFGALALEYYDKYMPERTRSIVLNNIAAVANIRGDYVNAEKHYRSSLEQAGKSEDKEMMTNVLSNLSLIFWEQNDFDRAVKYAQKAQAIAHDINDLYAERTAYTRLKDAWQSKGDFAKAYLAQSIEMELYHRIYQSNAPLDIAQAEAGFLQKRLKAQIDKYREQNLALEESNRTVTKKTMELETQNNLLVATNSLLNRIISIIAHDVRGPVATIRQTAELMLKGIFKDQLDELVKHLYESSEETEHLIEELLELARKYKAGLDEDPEIFDLMTALHQGKKLADVSASSKDISIEIISNSECIPIRIARNRLNLIVRNLVSNAIKYSEPGTTITVKVELSDEQISLSVQDQGTGMDDSQIQRIMAGRSFSMPGTNEEKGFGMGLVFVLEAIKHTGGSLEIHSEPGKGSCFTVSYNLAKTSP